ncbi:MAG: ATP-binding protein [Oscillospiraceae bacterium]|nr:ATP-binding protein [Oscillospiraceae bacterium]
MENRYNEKALRIIEARRTKAEFENELHRNEIFKKIPEMAAIDQQLCSTGKRLINIIKDNDRVEERMESLKDFNLRCQQLKKNYLIKNGYPEDYLQTKYYCKICEDTGFHNGKMCQCMKEICHKLAVEDMNKSAHIKLTTFDSFNLEYYKSSSANNDDSYETMCNIYKYCRNYALNFSENSESILMTGRTGLGKTHLSLSIASEIISKGYSVIYDSIINLLSKIEREHFGRDTETDTLSVIFDTDLLILDDLGTEFDTQFNVSAVYNIIDTRINRNLPTIVSTNLSMEQIRKKYEERIVSRLFASYRYLEFKGEDIRQIKRLRSLS